ncbi:MAG: hypothetical protein QM296_06895 [Bacillota bacterium]|nr:hypothetical protein [Bacillota bacterium]
MKHHNDVIKRCLNVDNGDLRVKRILAYEPWFFIFFGVFHLHRIWAILDRDSYAAFWLGLMENRGLIYCFIMGLLAILCVIGIVTFLHERRRNFWWRWIYLLGGLYVLFDLFAIATRISFWQRLLLTMFDTSSPAWNAVWFSFILLGALSFLLGVHLLQRYVEAKDAQ